MRFAKRHNPDNGSGKSPLLEHRNEAGVGLAAVRLARIRSEIPSVCRECIFDKAHDFIEDTWQDNLRHLRKNGDSESLLLAWISTPSPGFILPLNRIDPPRKISAAPRVEREGNKRCWESV